MTHPIQTYHRQPTSLNVTTQHVIHGQIIIVLSLTNNWGYRVSGVKHFGTLLENIEVVALHTTMSLNIFLYTQNVLVFMLKTSNNLLGKYNLKCLNVNI